MNGEMGDERPGDAERVVLIQSMPAFPGRNVLEAQGVGSPFRWIYLGKDYPRLIALEREIGHGGERIPTGDRLQQTAEKYRRDYIDFIGSLLPKEEPIRWWASSVSEKNPFASDLFLSFCFVAIAREVITSEKGNLVIICEDPAVGKAITEQCPDAEGRILLVPDTVFHRTGTTIAGIVAGVSRKCWFILRYSCRILAARVFRFLKGRCIMARGPPPTRPVLLHTWTDDRAFGRENQFENVFFQGLADRLYEQNRPFVYLADVLPTVSYIPVISRLLKSPAPVYLLEEFLSVGDVFRSLLYLRSPPAVDTTKGTLHGISLARMIGQGFSADTRNTRREESYLRYLSTRQIARRLHPSSFVYLFENHVWEKLFIAGFRSNSPGTLLTGYVHTVVRYMHLCYSVAKGELDRLPLPDRIVVNGRHAQDALIRSGFPEDIIRDGGALRYPELSGSVNQNRPRAGTAKKTVLIALSAGLQESVELLIKSLCALKTADAAVIIKCHPILPYPALSRYIPDPGNNASVSEEPVSQILARTDLLLYSETTVCIEALARGIPVIHVRSDCRIDLDVLDSLPSVRSESDPARLSGAIHAALAGNGPEPGTEERTFLTRLFSPVPKNIVEIYTNP